MRKRNQRAVDDAPEVCVEEVSRVIDVDLVDRPEDRSIRKGEPMKAQIVMLPGDGIGPEVSAAAEQALVRVAELHGHEFSFSPMAIGGAAIDACGIPLPNATLQACLKADAIFLGAVGGPKWSDSESRPELGLLKLRKELGVFANLRPVQPLPALADVSPVKPEILRGVDMLVVRELTGGVYFSLPRGRSADRGFDTMAYSRDEVARIARVAFEQARRRRKKVTSVDKANVLESSRLWRESVCEVAEDFPDVELEHQLVDSAAMEIIRNPARFDVILTTNLFGDILSDEAGVLCGSLGMLPSASIGTGRPGLFEPVHGSAPDIAGKGLANPIGALLSAALLCEHGLGLPQEADCIREAVCAVVQNGGRTRDISPGEGLSTSEFTDQFLTKLGVTSCLRKDH